jgi:hypothetical protein
LEEEEEEEDRLRRQRAHDIARTIESLHVAGSVVDPETMAIAQRYVDGEISSDEPDGCDRSALDGRVDPR